MSHALHTAGPWEVKPEEVGCSYIRIRGTRLGGRFKIANAVMHAYDGMPAAYAQCERNEVRANARLIAAAPDLLEALQAVAAYADVDAVKGLSGMVRDAIAKAIGGAT